MIIAERLIFCWRQSLAKRVSVLVHGGQPLGIVGFPQRQPTMTDLPNFLPKERDLIRREFMVRFSSARSLHDGILVKRWATGPNKGQPMPAPAVQSMIERGLSSLGDDAAHWLKATFRPAGSQALRRMAADKRALPPDQYQHLLDELAMLP